MATAEASGPFTELVVATAPAMEGFWRSALATDASMLERSKKTQGELHKSNNKVWILPAWLIFSNNAVVQFPFQLVHD
jgi:hypothetical protein